MNDMNHSIYRIIAIIIPTLIFLIAPTQAIIASAQLSPIQATGGNTTQIVSPSSNNKSGSSTPNVGNAMKTTTTTELCTPSSNNTTTAAMAANPIRNATTGISNSTSATFAGEKVYPIIGPAAPTNASSLRGNNTHGANTTTTTIQQSLTLARMHLEEGCGALKNNDISGALLHFSLVESALKDIQGNLTSSTTAGKAAANISVPPNGSSNTNSINHK
jgi:hypothetical protein